MNEGAFIVKITVFELPLPFDRIFCCNISFYLRYDCCRGWLLLLFEMFVVSFSRPNAASGLDLIKNRK